MKEAGRKSLDAQARGRHGRLAAVPAPGGHDLHGWQQVLMRLRQFRITAVLRTGVGRLLIAGREGQAVVETSVAQPLEAQIIGVDQMLYMKSTSGNDGSYTLTVSFALGSDPNIDTVNVNNRVQTALSQLPPEVQLQGLVVQKKSSAILQFIVLYSENGQQDPLFITNYAIINVLDAISRTPGVGQANLFAKMNYSMRIWFDTQRLTSLNLAPSDVLNAIRTQSVQAPVGRIGARPISDQQQFQLNVQTQGRLSTPEQFGNIVLRANPDGSTLRVHDVARVEIGAQNLDSESRIDGRAGVPIGIYLAPGANAVATANAVQQTLQK